MNSFSDLMVFMPAFKKGDIFAGSSSGGLSIGLAGAHQATLQCDAAAADLRRKRRPTRTQDKTAQAEMAGLGCGSISVD
jgi:hypothetical protein